MNFDLKKNDCIGLKGKSGEGKTTFVDIMLGLLTPQKGEIIVNDNLLKVWVKFYWKYSLCATRTSYFR